MPGFTYQYARYTDWIGHFLSLIVEQDLKDPRALLPSQKTGLKVVQSLYDKLTHFITSID